MAATLIDGKLPKRKKPTMSMHSLLLVNKTFHALAAPFYWATISLKGAPNIALAKLFLLSPHLAAQIKAMDANVLDGTDTMLPNSYSRAMYIAERISDTLNVLEM
jgi:hypothetical protein